MKEITIVEPVLVSTFKCSGSACRNHCCQGWNIVLDKSTINRYLKSSDREIRSIASENIVITKGNYSRWGKIKLESGRACAYMDSVGLCKIHAKLGAKALSKTCMTYPRLQQVYRYELYKSLTLSCPEAAKILLTNPDAMLLGYSTTLAPEGNNNVDYSPEDKLINFMCMNIIKASKARSEEGLYGLATLFVHLEKMRNNKTFSVPALEEAYTEVIESLEQGVIRENLAAIKPNHDLQWALLMRLRTTFLKLREHRTLKVLNSFIDKLSALQIMSASAGDTSLAIQRLDVAWRDKVEPWLADRPYLMSNYLQYRIYTDNFYDFGDRSPLNCLYLLTAEWYLLKALMCASVEVNDGITEEDIIDLFYSYHAITKHSTSAMTAFFTKIDKVKVHDDLSLIFLLK